MNEIYCKIITQNPAIIYGAATKFTGHLGPASEVGRTLSNVRIIWLIIPWWSLLFNGIVENIAREYQEYTAAVPNHRIIFLCNEDGETNLLKLWNIEAFTVNQNIFVDENIFTVQSQDKPFTAVYNARLSPFKNHYLARHVKSLALLYADFPRALPEFVDFVRTILPAAHFLNHRDGKYRSFSSSEIARWINKARVGLCLSLAEGAMYASVEYLLCGLPIVSIFNIGGRDFFYDPRFWLRVKGEPACVARGVTELAEREIEPEFIRAQTISKLIKVREDFNRLINRLLIASGCSDRFDVARVFSNKLLLQYTPEEFVKSMSQILIDD